MFVECNKIIVCLEGNSTLLQTVAYSESRLHLDNLLQFFHLTNLPYMFS